MIVAICILVGLLLCAIFVITSLWYALGKLFDEYIDSNPKYLMDYYLENESEDCYNCNLILTENNNAGFDGSVYDFSRYEEMNIIGLINCKNNKSEDEDEIKIALLPNQKVYKMKDGSFQWDCRGLI